MDVQMVSPTNYDRVMRTVHWTTLVLVAAVFGTIWIADPALVGSYARPIVQLHRSIGLTVAALTVFRLVWRLRARIPALPGDLSKFQKLAARATEALLYVLLVVQPLVGLTYTNASGQRVDFYFLARLPALVDRNKPLAALVGDAHSLVGYTMLAVIGLHAAAALFHHYVRRDEVLNAMLPVQLRR